ncbi:exocyst complex subunit Sec15-like-domain-containing protein [Syncephalis plumigaleata]|nr:exocyst complex subunit Sec15-like-domain-containing protein [Syncephalis plumigaleata]
MSPSSADAHGQSTLPSSHNTRESHRTSLNSGHGHNQALAPPSVKSPGLGGPRNNPRHLSVNTTASAGTVSAGLKSPSREFTLLSDAGTEFDSLDQMGPAIQAICQTGREQAFIGEVAGFVERKEGEIERLCNMHYQDFIKAVEELLLVRQGTVALKEDVLQLNGELQVSGEDLVAKRAKLYAAQRIRENIQLGIDQLQRCLHVLKLANKVRIQLEHRNYYTGLRTLEELEDVHLRKVAKYEFAKHMEKWIPLMKENIKSSVMSDLKEWLFNLREQSRMVGELAMQEASDLQARSPKGETVDTALELVLDEENDTDLLEDKRVTIDFKPLYQCIHIYEKLGRKNEFKKHYEEDRQAQVDLILKAKIDATPEGKKALGDMLQEILGFFIIEHRIAHTTREFRSKARVEVLWTMVAERITRMISDSIRQCSDIDALSQVKQSTTLFVPALEHYMFDTRKPRELTQILIERCAALTLSNCGSQFKERVADKGFQPMTIRDEKEYKVLRGLYKFPEEPDARKQGFPRTLPFGSVIPLICADIKRSVDQFYSFAVNESGQPVVPQVDSIVQNAVDGFLSKTVPDVLRLELKTTSMMQVVQLNANVEHFDHVCGEFEKFLTERRKIKLKARDAFEDIRKQAEKRIFELINSKLDSFLVTSDYDWTPKKVRTQPANYLVELVGYLKEMFTTVLTHLPANIKSLVTFEAMDHLATSMNELLLGSKMKKFNGNFVANMDIDVKYLERFLDDLGDPMLLDSFIELRQVITLFSLDSQDEYLDIQIRNRKYSRLKPAMVMALFEKFRS